MQWLLSDYRHLQKRLKRFFWNSGQSTHDAEDLIQEALLRLQQYCQKGEVQDAESFLIRTVQNLSVDQRRRDHRHLFDERTVEDLDARTPLVDPAPAVDVIFEAQQRLHRIATTLEAVSPRTREVYFAHRAGYSYQEIEAHLGISRSTIEKHIARAVLALVKAEEIE
jgi:RNA polymerase sigma factor (sigma-70 family)